MHILSIIFMEELKITILKEVLVVHLKDQESQTPTGSSYLEEMVINLQPSLEIQILFMLNLNKVISIELTELMEKQHLLNLKMMLANHMKDLIGMHQFWSVHMIQKLYFLDHKEFGFLTIEEMIGSQFPTI